MPAFNFQGRDKAGQLIQGMREGDAAENVAAALLNEGIIPIQITPAALTKTASAAGKFNIELPFFNKVPLSDIIMFSRQMASLHKAGIPLSTALKRLAESAHNPRFAQTLTGVTQLLMSGKTLTSAMQAYPKIFPPFIINLIRIGEESAQLDVVFQQIADYLELQDNNTKRMRAVVRYPLFVISAIVIGVIVINLFVLPTFAKLYGNLHVQLPLPTRILLSTSIFIKTNGYYMLVAILMMVMAIYYYFTTARGKLLWARYQFRLPIIGSILERIMLARVVSTLAITLRGGIPLVESIGLIASVSANIYVQQCLFVMKNMLEQGETLTKAAGASGLFNPLILQMLTVGEETGRLDDLLMEVTRFYEQEVDYDLKTLAARLEPLLLFIVAGMVLLLALGVFLPMWNLIQLVR